MAKRLRKYRLIVRSDERGEHVVAIRADSGRRAAEIATERGLTFVDFDLDREAVETVALLSVPELVHPDVVVVRTLPLVHSECAYGSGVLSGLKMGWKPFDSASDAAASIIHTVAAAIRFNLQYQAARIGADFVLGVHIDIQSHGHNNKDFHGYGYGTPVKVAARWED